MDEKGLGEEENYDRKDGDGDDKTHKAEKDGFVRRLRQDCAKAGLGDVRHLADGSGYRRRNVNKKYCNCAHRCARPAAKLTV